MRRLFQIVASIIPVLLLAGCNRSGKPILIVLPDGFTGEFRIVKDSQNGREPVEENGSWVFEIPSDGTLRVKDDRPFYSFHEQVIRYKNGKSVRCEDLGTLAGSRPTGPNSSEASTDFDGTTHEWRVIGR
jgi:hypothetical protein